MAPPRATSARFSISPLCDGPSSTQRALAQRPLDALAERPLHAAGVVDVRVVGPRPLAHQHLDGGHQGRAAAQRNAAGANAHAARAVAAIARAAEAEAEARAAVAVLPGHPVGHPEPVVATRE